MELLNLASATRRWSNTIKPALKGSHNQRHHKTKIAQRRQKLLVALATESLAIGIELVLMQRLDSWHGTCNLQFHADSSGSQHQGGCTSPFKLMRAERGANGRCELPLLHTAGGLVGGDQLSINLNLKPSSRCLITSVAAQKVYGSVGRSQLHPQGVWAQHNMDAELHSASDLEWLPQEVVLYSNALFHQNLTVSLPLDGSFLSAEIVRLGRTAASETLGKGRWRSSVQLHRRTPEGILWELVDRLELSEEALQGPHGLNQKPVFGSLIWAAPFALEPEIMNNLIKEARRDRCGLKGEMHCGQLHQGLIARYSGDSSRDARFWFSRIWALTRQARNLSTPTIPRVWPLQENPFRP